MRYKFVYSLVGSLLGLGAPVGIILIRLTFYFEWNYKLLTQDYHQFSFFYDYISIGAVLSFTTFGFVLGSKIDNITTKEQKFYELSIRDPLTSIYNRRFIEHQLGAELKRAQRYNNSLSCLMLDIDFFKKVNDTYGHVFGDKVLLKLVNVIEKRIRAYDVFARYGGEEFIVVLPHTNLEDAKKLAENIREEIESAKLEVPTTQILLKKDRKSHVGPKEITTTISIGVCSFPEHPIHNVTDFIKHVDSALYDAKNKGRNQTKVCQRGH